jgi:hypothetical protein
VKITGRPLTIPRAATSPSLVRSARSVWEPEGVLSPGEVCQLSVLVSVSIGRHEPR